MECDRCGKIFYRDILGSYEVDCKKVKEIYFGKEKHVYKDQEYKVKLCHNCSKAFDRFMRCENGK